MVQWPNDLQKDRSDRSHFHSSRDKLEGRQADFFEDYLSVVQFNTVNTRKKEPMIFGSRLMCLLYIRCLIVRNQPDAVFKRFFFFF